MERTEGKLLVLMPGLGAVATTFVAGVELARRRIGLPIGSLSQLGTACLGQRSCGRAVPIRELVPLASLDDLVFGAWDIVSEDAATVALRSGVLSGAHLAAARPALEGLRPRRGIHDPARVRRIQPDHAARVRGHRHAIDVLRRDIDEMRAETGALRAVMICTASTETHRAPPEFARDPDQLERAIDRDDPRVSPSMLYAYAALVEGVPFANATPNRAVDLPALQQLAIRVGVPVAGRDLKSGQTMMKTVVAPALKARLLGLRGWFSTNILGNRDGEILDDPDAFHTKEATKSCVLDALLEPELYPALYGGFTHKVAIHYYPPRGDEKGGWDSVDIVGWLGYPMQIKIDFQCRDSILAAPLVLDLALFLDLAERARWSGVQEWLSFYFKSPMAAEGSRPEHDLFVQRARLEGALRALAGAEPLSHLTLQETPCPSTR